jgi:DNA-binding NarL/FixJ family response regulator
MPGPRQQIPPIRVLVVDDSPLVRRALVERLSDEDDLTVVGACEDGSEVVAAAERLRPDVVFMDLSMPVMDGLEATEALCDVQEDARVIMLTADGGSARDQAEAAGARALVPKGTSPRRMLECLRTVVQDGDGCPFCF